MFGVTCRYALMALLLLFAAACPLRVHAQETKALEVQPIDSQSLQLAETEDIMGESQAFERAVEQGMDRMFSVGTLELWRNISANYRMAGDILRQIRDNSELAGDDSQERLAIWSRYGPLLVQTRNRLNDLRRLVDERLADGALADGTERLAYSVWQDDLYRVIGMLDNDVIVLDRDASFYGGLSNDVYDETFGEGVYESPMESTFWGGETRKEEPGAEWEYEAEFGFQSGQSTYAENEAHTFEFVERLKAAGGNEYEFYQEYNRDISYVESATWTFGAEQKIKDILWDGDLRLKEEFSEYRDKSDSTNDLQEGEFKLSFNPEWADGRWGADVDYKYNVKVYETFSSRSYKLNSGKLKLEHEFSKDFEGEVFSSFDDYNYSIGSDRGNSKTKYGSSFDWDVTNDFSLGVELEQENKNYDVRKDRNHIELGYDFSMDWKPDDDSQFSIKHGITDYDRYYDPGDNYEENSTSASYRRSLSEELDFDLKWSYRDKQFDIVPLDDTLQRGYGLGLNYNPDAEWNFSYSFDNRDNGYVDPVREYEARSHRGGVRWSHHNIGVSFDVSTSENLYAMDALRDYARDDFNLDFDYRFDRHSVRVYYGVGYLDQADPASTNDYTETRVGASWDYELSEEAELSISYDFNEREYDSQPLQEDNRLQAIISFRF